MSTKAKGKATQDNGEGRKKVSSFHDSWNRLLKQKVAVACMIIIGILLVLALFADVFFDYDAQVVAQNVRNTFASPSLEYWLGTDQYGRDLAVRIIYGIRSALLMGVIGSAISSTIGTILATVASYYGGRVDDIIMRFCDVLNCIPALVLAIAICAGLGGGMWQLVIALAVSGIAGSTRMIRSRAISVANSGYIESSMALGASPIRIIFGKMLPNLLDIIIINSTGDVSRFIMMGTTLSFIGLGVQSPVPEWGLMLNENIAKMEMYPGLVIWPTLAIIITTLAIATLGDYMRDAFDPKLKGKA